MESFLLFVGIQVGWLAAVIGAASGYPWFGPVVIGAILAIHAAFSQSRSRLLVTALVFGCLGYAADALLVLTGLLGYPPIAELGSPGSFWMAALWMNLAPAFPKLEWLGGRWGWIGALGLVGGPIAYLGGQRLGAVTFPAGTPFALGAVGIEWMLAAPLMLWFSLKLQSRGPTLIDSNMKQVKNNG